MQDGDGDNGVVRYPLAAPGNDGARGPIRTDRQDMDDAAANIEALSSMAGAHEGDLLPSVMGMRETRDWRSEQVRERQLLTLRTAEALGPKASHGEISAESGITASTLSLWLHDEWFRDEWFRARAVGRDIFVDEMLSGMRAAGDYNAMLRFMEKRWPEHYGRAADALAYEGAATARQGDYAGEAHRTFNELSVSVPMEAVEADGESEETG